MSRPHKIVQKERHRISTFFWSVGSDTLFGLNAQVFHMLSVFYYCRVNETFYFGFMGRSTAKIHKSQLYARWSSCETFNFQAKLY